MSLHVSAAPAHSGFYPHLHIPRTPRVWIDLMSLHVSVVPVHDELDMHLHIPRRPRV